MLSFCLDNQSGIVMFSLFGFRRHAVKAGLILPATRLPPAFTPRERAAVEAYFGRKDGRRAKPAGSDADNGGMAGWRR